MSYKKIKKELKNILSANTPQYALNEFDTDKEKLINPAIGLLYESNPIIKHRAAELIGLISKDLDLEKIRVLMRRLMWNLNDESGGIGWGSPEAMAEIFMASEKIYHEFISIFISYIDPESGTHLDHEDLHPGVIWGIGRIKEHIDSAKNYSVKVLLKAITSKNPAIRGLSIWAAHQCMLSSALENEIQNLTDDNTDIDIYFNNNINTESIAQLAKKALASL